MQICPLPRLSRPLLDKFYRAHQSSMRVRRGALTWVMRDPDEIVAALCLTGVDGGHWLTGLFVAPSRRGEGLAGRLIEAATVERDGPVWLFCDPDLAGFYERQGFTTANHLPQVLAGRLSQYRLTKHLVAMQLGDWPLQTPAGTGN